MNPDPNPMASIQQEAAETAPPATEAAPNAVASLAARLKPLVLPSNRHPNEFTGKPLPVVLNKVFDGKDAASSQAQLGESIGLCADAVHPGSAEYGLPPLGYLAWSTYRFFRIRRGPRGRKEVRNAPTNQDR